MEHVVRQSEKARNMNQSQGNQAFQLDLRSSRHLRVVTEADVRLATQQRVQQWEALKAGYPTPVKLTKRGRRLVAILLFLPIAGVFWLTSSHGASAADGKPATRTVVVQSGQSLWDLAVTSDPNRDPRQVVFEIKQLNGFSGSEVFPGQAVVIPNP